MQLYGLTFNDQIWHINVCEKSMFLESQPCPLSKGGGCQCPQVFWTSYICRYGMTHSSQILCGVQTRCDECFYQVNHSPGQKFCDANGDVPSVCKWQMHLKSYLYSYADFWRKRLDGTVL